MNKHAKIALAGGVAALAVAAPGVASLQGPTTAARGFVQVSAREFSLGLSRGRVRPGTVTFELVNFGQDDHNVSIRRRGGSSTVSTGVVHPGNRDRVTTKLRSGTYDLWCTIDDHRKLGMHALLKVRR